MLPTQNPRVDPLLSAFVTEYKNADFVCDSLGPILPSDTKTVKYGRLDKLNLFRSIDDNLARYGEANEVGFGSDTATVEMSNWALRCLVAHEDVEDHEDKYLDLAQEGLTVVRATLALQREIRQFNKIRSALVSASRSADGGNWLNYTSSPDDVVTKVKTQARRALFELDWALTSKQVIYALERHPSLTALWFDGNTGKKVLTKEQIAEVLGLKGIIVGDGRYTTTKRPVTISASTEISDANTTSIIGDNFVLFRKAEGKPNRVMPGLFYQFRRKWSKSEGLAGSTPDRVRTWDVPQLGMGGAYVVQQEYQSLDLVFPEMGYVFTGCLS